MEWDPFDPIGSIQKLLMQAYDAMLTAFTGIITNAPTHTDWGILPVAYGSGLNLAAYLAYLVLVVGVVFSLFFFHKIDRVGKAILTIVVIAVLTPAWVTIVNWMVDAGTTLANIANFYDPPDKVSPSYELPTIKNAVGAFTSYTFALIFGGFVAVILAHYEVLIIAFKLIGPIAYSLSSFGKRTKQFCNIVISMGLVATLFGRPFAVLFLEFGQVARYTFPFGRTGFGAAVYTIGSYSLAFWSQVVLFFACYFTVTAVEGKVVGAFKGVTQTFVTKMVPVNVNKIRQNNLMPVPVPMRVQANRGSHVDRGISRGKEMAKGAVRTVGRAGTTIAGAAVSATGNVPAGAAIGAAGGAFFADRPKKAA